uniref:Peroxiredoxin 1 n=1 Tax=Brugia malayi TaxID=6279 RepID=TDX1_BRUMA|nr:RecName: Full=Peroxiredoxin 1; AltName: Full=Thiol-specific antioxidant protein 1; AltName: Full=Thioredoxin peroxidase 1; Short=Bm-TPx-1; AltName: Full=Thioredoxin-dependent peroxide reductase 1; AltName: Full=Thioredoxin-dependent peroxiredoxin 1 [Brugia malayi]AAC23701.1 thiredoxin peroxidase 1 [Brugia malayi]
MIRSVLASVSPLRQILASQLCTSSITLAGIRPLGPKNKAPDFSGTAVVNGDFKTISMKDYKGKWLILFFYPLDFTFVCPTEITAFSDRCAEFQKLNTELIACSCDSHFSHLAWIQTPRSEVGGLGDMKIPVLADFNKDIANAFGVLDHETGISYRGLFLIDPSGEIRHSLVNDLSVGRSVDEAFRTLKAFQFVEKHGEVCPANWSDDKPTIKPGIKESKEYFKKVDGHT